MKTPKSKTVICLYLVALLACAERVRADRKLIEIMPDDALFGLHIERPRRALPPKLLKPLLDAVSANEKTAGVWLESPRRSNRCGC